MSFADGLYWEREKTDAKIRVKVDAVIALLKEVHSCNMPGMELLPDAIFFLEDYKNKQGLADPKETFPED